MSNTFLPECVTGHRIKPTDPCDIGLEWVDHKIAVGGTDGAFVQGYLVSEIAGKGAEKRSSMHDRLVCVFDSTSTLLDSVLYLQLQLVTGPSSTGEKASS